MTESPPASKPHSPGDSTQSADVAVGRAARIVAGASVLISPLLVHVALTTGRLAWPAALLASVQTAVVVALALRGRVAGAAWLGAGAALAILLACRVALRGSLSLEAGLAHTALYISLLVLFGRTLLPGRTPIVTALARRIHGERTPELRAYTRRVTGAWCVFFAAQLAGSALLARLAPLWAWSLFVNVLDAPLVVLMFAAEYAYRLLRFRNQSHARPADIVRAFARESAAPAAPPRA